MKMTLTKADVLNVYDELDRRMDIDYVDGYFTASQISAERTSRLQGVYGTLKVLADNWRDVVSWISDIETERYW